VCVCVCVGGGGLNQSATLDHVGCCERDRRCLRGV